MYRSPQFAALLTALLLTTSASAASFDCKLAKSPRERAVCASPQLSAKDSALAAAYTRTRSRLSPAAAAVVQADQRFWLSYLDRACPAHSKGDTPDITECLADEYANRLTDLKAQPPLAAGNAVYTHHVAVLAAGKLDADNPRNPGFGTASFSIPQIDNANAQQQAFNEAVSKAVVNQASDDPQKPATSFEGVADSESTMQVTYRVAGENARLLAANFEIFEVAYGAAHPSTSDFTFSWWLDSGRELQAADIFRADSSWKTALPGLIATKLNADKDRGPYFSTGTEFSQGIGAGLKNTRQWTVSRDGLTITYGQYQVAAYVAGMPSVHFTWKELAPYLNPELHPEALPIVKPQDN